MQVWKQIVYGQLIPTTSGRNSARADSRMERTASGGVTSATAAKCSGTTLTGQPWVWRNEAI